MPVKVEYASSVEGEEVRKLSGEISNAIHNRLRLRVALKMVEAPGLADSHGRTFKSKLIETQTDDS